MTPWLTPRHRHDLILSRPVAGWHDFPGASDHSAGDP